MNIVFMGSPEFAVPSMSRLIQDGHNITAVYTQADKPAGRGQTLHVSPIKALANSLGIPVRQPLTLKDLDVQQELKRDNPDLIVLVAYGLFLPPAVLETPKYGCLNIHPSLLPRHRGAAPVVSTLLSGDKWAGVTLMKMDNGWDTGDILASSKVLVRDDDNTAILMDKLSHISSCMLSEYIPLWVEGKLKAVPQNHEEATYFKMMNKEFGLLDWSEDNITIWNKVRALQPWPGTFTYCNGKLLKILSAHPVDADGEPGSIVKTKTTVDVICGQGALRLDVIQPEGKKAMPAIDYARGNGFPEGIKLSNTL